MNDKYSGVSIADNKKVIGELEERDEGNDNISLWIGFWDERETIWQNHRVYANTVKREEK